MYAVIYFTMFIRKAKPIYKNISVNFSYIFKFLNLDVKVQQCFLFHIFLGKLRNLSDKYIRWQLKISILKFIVSVAY